MTTSDETRFIASKAPEEAGYPGMQPAKFETDSTIFERDVAVELRDGTVIYADVHRPVSLSPVPVLVAYGPYGKHAGFPDRLGRGADIEDALPAGTQFEAPIPSYWVGHGYAVVYVDKRGTWGSEGDATSFSKQEAEDGYDVVEWAGTQPWSNGKVGLSGVSYLALVQYGIAALRPPHLAAINPSEGVLDIYREAMTHGGIPETQFSINLNTIVGFGRGRTEDLLSEAIEHPVLDAFWASKTPVVEDIEVPAYFVCSVGNHGIHTRGTLDAYLRASSSEKWLEVHGQKEWRYYYNRDSVERQRAFFDHFLLGRDTEITAWPPVRVEYRDRSEGGPIRPEQSWPPSTVTMTPLYLDASSGSLRDKPVDRGCTVSYDPTRSPKEPALHAGEEKVEFEYVFRAETYLAGNAALRLFAASPGASDMDVFVELEKLDVDGNPISFPYFAYLDDGPLAHGWLRASRRELDPALSTPDRPVQAHLRDEPLPTDGPVQLDIEIWPFTALFHPGEALRLTVAGADIHRWVREDFVRGHDMLNNTAAHILYTGGGWSSTLMVPIVAS